MAKSGPCTSCGQLQGIKEYDAVLWDTYDRLDDGGRRHIEPFVYTGEELDEMGVWDDEDSHAAWTLSVERNMAERGLCPTCGRPDLSGVTPDRIMSEEDARSLNDMYAEMAAERRAGC